MKISFGYTLDKRKPPKTFCERCWAGDEEQWSSLRDKLEPADGHDAVVHHSEKCSCNSSNQCTSREVADGGSDDGIDEADGADVRVHCDEDALREVDQITDEGRYIHRHTNYYLQ